MEHKTPPAHLRSTWSLFIDRCNRLGLHHASTRYAHASMLAMASDRWLSRVVLNRHRSDGRIAPGASVTRRWLIALALNMTPADAGVLVRGLFDVWERAGFPRELWHVDIDAPIVEPPATEAIADADALAWQAITKAAGQKDPAQ